MDAKENAEQPASIIESTNPSPVRDTQRSATVGKDVLTDYTEQLKSPLRTLTNVTRIQTLDTKKSSKTLERILSPKSPISQRTSNMATLPELVRRSPARPEFVRPFHFTPPTRDDIFNKSDSADESEGSEESEETNIILQQPKTSSVKGVSKAQVENLRKDVSKAKQRMKKMELELSEARKKTGDMRKQLKLKEVEEAKEKKILESAKKEYVDEQLFTEVKNSLKNIEKEIEENNGIIEEFTEIMNASNDEGAKDELIDQLMNLIPEKMFRVQELKGIQKH